MSIDDPNFLSSRELQLKAVNDLAKLRLDLIERQTVALKKMHERRALIQRLTAEILEHQQEHLGRVSYDRAFKEAYASDELEAFDARRRPVVEEIQRLKVELERHQLAIQVAGYSPRPPSDAEVVDP